MVDYFFYGFIYLLGSIRFSIIVYFILNVIFLFSGKRKFKEDFRTQKKKILFEFLLLLYMCTILKITGVIGMNFNTQFNSSVLKNIIIVPFVGSNIKMVILNILMFVPYGILLPIVFTKRKWDVKGICFISFCSSLCIEILQLFGGRLCEIDDLIANIGGTIIGYLVLQLIKKLCSKRNHTRKMLWITAFLIIGSILICTNFVLMSEDIASLQAVEENMEIANDKAMHSIELFRVYDGKIERDISKNPNRDTWYSWMGESVSNMALYYISKPQNCKTEEIVTSNSGPYIEVVFQDEQFFSFCNNKEWNLENVKHLVYCIKDGTLWYGTDKDKLEYCSYYGNEDFEFQ